MSAATKKRKAKGEPKVELTPNEERLRGVVSELYSLANRLRTLEWGNGNRRPLDFARAGVDEIGKELRMLHLGYPVGPVYVVAQMLATARDEWELCKDCAVGFEPATFANPQLYKDADEVPAGLAFVTVRKRNSTNMGEYEHREYTRNGFDRLDGLIHEIEQAAGGER